MTLTTTSNEAIFVPGPAVAFTVPGRAHGKGRPRFTNGRTYTDAATVQAEHDVLTCWQAAGGVRLADGPVHLSVTVFCERPKSHYKRDGVTLNAEGLRRPLPDNQKPDFDNCFKSFADALNGRAWRDDVQIVSAAFLRLWGTPARVNVTAYELGYSDLLRTPVEVAG